MNYIKQLTYFFNKATADTGLTPTQTSLFMALFQLWNQARFTKSIQIVRDEAMRLSKINSKATYHKAMAYLHKNGYIDYQPSYNPFKGSAISFFPENITPTDMENEPVQNMSTRTINEPFNKQYSNHIINHNMITQSLDKKKDPIQKKSSAVVTMLSKPQKEKSSGQKEKGIPPQRQLVEEFFISQKSTLGEAHRFINHYTANGWLVGGKSPMKDWKASANNWISNSINFNTHGNFSKSNRAQQLNTNTKKNYFEPL
ncbi:transcriptional regulator [Sphingobacterium faecium]|uniref:transcriptional regulator n=1 Tax=Sphingobacterium faecium TaxID=34087 RepID=UPI0024DFC2A4|nr:transcriptional regulator [Sphingobacterium faecium]